MDKIHLRIGSALDNQLVIESVDVAPHHLELFCDTSGNVFITDLGSEQGTFVNNRRLDGFKLLKKETAFTLVNVMFFNGKILFQRKRVFTKRKRNQLCHQKNKRKHQKFPGQQQAIIHHLWVYRIFDYPNVLVSIRASSFRSITLGFPFVYRNEQIFKNRKENCLKNGCIQKKLLILHPVSV
jgi:hypothetical protein